MKNRLFSAIVLSILSLCILPSCNKAVAVTGVKLDKTSLSLTVGQTANLNATIEPSNATISIVTWKSSDTGVASVNNGTVTAVKAGSATITVITADGGKTATCSVTVKAAVVNVTGVALDKTTLTLTEGDNATLSATVSPADATDKTVSWSSSDAKVATVDNGKVTAVAAGTAKITVTTTDGAKTAECAVTVNKKVIAVTGVSLDAASATLVVGQTKQLTATVKPDDASDKTVAWSSSNAAIASVDATGKVTAVKAGSATITVVTNGTNASGKTEMATCDITVTQPVSGVSLDKTSLTMTEGEAATLTATVSPADASDKTVTWSSSDAAIATVDNGKVTAIAAGSAKITVTTKDGGKTAECAVTVNKKVIPVTGVTLDKTTANMIVGQTQQLTATVKPDDASDKTVSWSSSNEKIASVDATGKVTAVASGAATITAKTNGLDASGKSVLATCDVTVTQPVSGVTLDKTSLTMTEGDTATLTATVKPDDASDKTVAWSTSDAAIATVDNGKVTAVKEGSAKITVTTKDGGKTAECDVTVSKKIIAVAGITLDKTTANMIVGQTQQLTATVTPDDASDKTVTWSSSNDKIATVDATGKVTAVAGGAATITAKTNGLDASGKSVLATCDVTVTQPVSGVTLDKTSLTMTEGDTATLTATVSPADASDKAVAWSTSDAAIATVDNGKVTAVKEGSAKITVTTKDGGKTAECAVTVNKKIIAVAGITLDKTTANMIVGQTQQLTATVTPADASDKTVSWSSSNEKIASVDATGKVTAVAGGAATITAKTNGLNAKGESVLATCDITVSQPVTGVKLDQGSVTLTVGESSVLTATVLPADATDKAVTWSTTAADIVSVDQSGHVKGLALGIATITVTTHDGEKTALCAVSVIQHVTEVSLDKTTADIVVGQTLQLTATVKPYDGTDKTVSWSSSNASVAEVDADGLVSAKTAGSATITVTTTDGGKMATCDVTVKEMNIYIPDANFKAYLVQNFDKNGDGEISLSEAAAVTIIDCSGKSIASMEGIQYFTALDRLICYDNKLTSLDLSNNTKLQLAYVGNQRDASNNYQTIFVKKGALADSVFPYLGNRSYGNYMVSFVINISIPDANFKEYLVQNFDTNDDGEISNVEAAAVTYIDCSSGKRIASLEGIQYFTALKELYCYYNQLTSLDLSKNTALTVLYCYNNQLASLDVSKNTALTVLYCNNNQLASLDVSKNTALTVLNCSSNQLTSLDVSNNTALTELYCGDNQLTSLNISANTALKYFECGANKLTSLDVSQNKALEILGCSYNQLTSLDLSKNTALTNLSCSQNQLESLDVSKNTALTVLNCSSNQLTSLNISANTALEYLNCSLNQLTSLDVSKNTALTVLNCSSNHLTSLDLSNNTSLQYAYVGKQTDASGNLQWISVKRGSLADSVFPYLGYSSHDNYMVSFVISIPDANFKAYLIQNFDTNGDGEISTAEAAAVTTIDCSGKSIVSLEGIQYFTASKELYCYDNQLTSLDVSKNTSLIKLHCYNNQLTSLDVSANTALTNLHCSSNHLTSLNLSKNTSLQTLLCFSNQLTSLDVSKNTALKGLYCHGNQLSSLDASTMAGPSSFILECGRQTDALGADKVLALVLSTSQKTRWEKIIADSVGAAMNFNVNVTYK